MAVQATVTLEPFVAGDTWPGISSITISNDGSPMPNNLVSARMYFKRNDLDKTFGARLTTEVGGGIQIVDAVNWELSIPVRFMPKMTPGEYVWDLETTDAGGNVQTFLRGTIKVLARVTH